MNIELEIPQRMEPPIYFYYKLTNFYQNHRRYVKSRSDDQLRGEAVTNLDSCDPLDKWAVPNSSEPKPLYPCGLIANSYFNDTFTNPTSVASTNGSTLSINWTDKGIAWESDVEKKFKPFSNYDSQTMTDIGPMGTPINHTKEDFIVWMRTAGLPTFKKLRYIIKDQALEAGTKLTVQIQNNFPVESFSGTKSVVLSTTSWLGGKNDFLGYAYVVVAGICLFLALIFGIKHKVSPRSVLANVFFNRAPRGTSSCIVWQRTSFIQLLLRSFQAPW